MAPVPLNSKYGLTEQLAHVEDYNKPELRQYHIPFLISVIKTENSCSMVSSLQTIPSKIKSLILCFQFNFKTVYKKKNKEL